MTALRETVNNVVVATLRDRRLIHTGPGQSGANVTTESLKSRRHAASAAAAGPYLLGAPKPSPPADAGVADANRPPNPGRRRRHLHRHRHADDDDDDDDTRAVLLPPPMTRAPPRRRSVFSRHTTLAAVLIAGALRAIMCAFARSS